MAGPVTAMVTVTVPFCCFQAQKGNDLMIYWMFNETTRLPPNPSPWRRQLPHITPLTGGLTWATEVLKLQQQKVTTDPPAKFQLLSLNIKTEGSNAGKQNDPDRSLSSLSSSQSPRPFIPIKIMPEGAAREDDADKGNTDGDKTRERPTNGNKTDDSSHQEGDPEDDIKDIGDGNSEPKIGKTGKKEVTAVLVKLLDPDNQKPPQEVFVGDFSTISSKTPGGSPKREALLTDLIPAILNNSSPVKGDRAGRFSRPGFGVGSIMDIGSVAQHQEGSVHQNLKWERANRYTLNDLGEGLFGADLYFKSSPVVTHASTPTSLTGAKSDRPIVIARARAQAATSAQVPTVPPPTKQRSTPEFGEFLRDFAQSPRLSQKKNTIASIGKPNFWEFQHFAACFSTFDKKTAGFLIPHDWDAPSYMTFDDWRSYRNITFTKDEIIEAAGLKASSTNSNNKAFKAALAAGGKIGQWVNSENEDLDDDAFQVLDRKYGPMTLTKFKRRTAAAQAKADNPTAGSSKTRRRKRRPSTSEGQSDDESHGEERRRKKGRKAEASKSRGKGKAKEKEADSDHLDSESESSDTD
ncbi:hypothetical protein B0H15DRAFT_805095 [Mycena belliarum]|uniref:Uncharacterized protein n=1 Tax=Mycena belliarum TaxID=1033014 RepID=A0AAD6XL18_9AGAR|nr:hypothetical protein B0H15DRAFT_805095 [Mycena belliae]